MLLLLVAPTGGIGPWLDVSEGLVGRQGSQAEAAGCLGLPTPPTHTVFLAHLFSEA